MSKYIGKNTLLFIQLLAIVLILFNCEQDDVAKPDEIVVFIPKNELCIQIKTGNAVSKEMITYLHHKTNNSLHVSYDKTGVSLQKNNNTAENATFGTINTDSEIVVINEHNTKHTFKVDNVSQYDNVIVNIIVVETATLTYEYFIKYTFEGSIPYDYTTNTLTVSRFTGTIETFTSEGNLTGSMDIEDGDVIQVNGQTSPCPDEVTPTDTTPPNTNDTDGSSNSAGIPGEGGNSNTTTNGNQNGTNDASDGGGWIQGDGPCGLNYTYICSNGYGGNHDPTTINSAGDLCSGTNNGAGILTVRDCNGNVLARNNSAPNPEGSDTINNPCAGIVGVLVSVEEAHQQNCDELKKLTDNATYAKPANTKYTDDAIRDLKLTLDDEGEFGYSLKKNSAGNTYAVNADRQGDKVVYAQHPNVFGGLHTHPDDDKKFPMFSEKDVKALLDFTQLYNSGTPVEPSLFVHVIVTYQFTYAIKIEDLSKLQQLTAIFADEGDINEDDRDEFKEFKDAYNTLFDSTYDNNGDFKGSKTFQKAFLRFITEEYDLGVSLYKLKEPTTSTEKPEWLKLSLEGTGDDSIVKEENPCPE
ncbi:hypothetical protein [Kordia sp.]|uniref:hypothetical protein n=1 Tax=Kordia sp. TaxID=1965332 RepID=UPI003D2C2F74